MSENISNGYSLGQQIGEITRRLEILNKDLAITLDAELDGKINLFGTNTAWIDNDRIMRLIGEAKNLEKFYNMV